MNRSSLICLAAIFLFSSNAYAGFEWTPPMQAPEVVYQQPAVQSPVPMTYPGAEAMGGFPAASVEVQPLEPQYATPTMPQAYQDPTPIIPQAYQAPVLQNMQNLSGVGLRIDPYPLRNLDSNTQPMALSEDSVHQAMTEEAKLLNPLKLGAGLKTGAQPTPAVIPTNYQQGHMGAPIPRGPVGGLTPMAGGEPAPLPGMGISQQYAVPPMNYAEAVGFGRELPLALALSQVIPSEFTHSFAPGVDVGATVSWEGGKPWNDVLNDMLRPQDLTANIQGNQVIIQPMARL